MPYQRKSCKTARRLHHVAEAETPNSKLYYVNENPAYRGRWWTDGGDRLWATYAPDEVDRCFFIPPESFFQFLALAQRIPEWNVDGKFPLFWVQCNDRLPGEMG